MPKGIYKRTEHHNRINSFVHTGIKHSKTTKEKMSKTRKGSKNPCWRGGRIKQLGYIYVYKPKHPFATQESYVFEHRLVIEKQIGRYLTLEEVGHHIGKRDDNRPQMLMAFVSHSAHKRFEKGGKIEQSEIIFDGRKLNKGRQDGMDIFN